MGFLVPFIPALIGAGASIGGAAMAASASKNAAQIQQQASDEALALTERMYQQDRADLEPYRRTGNWALGQLGFLAGMPAETGQAPMAPPPTQAPMTLASTSPLLSRAPAVTPPRPDRWGPTAAASPQAFGQQAFGGGGQSSYVTMVAPTGEEKDIPASQVPLYLQKGAKVKHGLV